MSKFSFQNYWAFSLKINVNDKISPIVFFCLSDKNLKTYRIIVIPWPPPIQADPKAYLDPVRFKAWAKCPVIRAPEAPSLKIYRLFRYLQRPLVKARYPFLILNFIWFFRNMTPVVIIQTNFSVKFHILSESQISEKSRDQISSLIKILQIASEIVRNW